MKCIKCKLTPIARGMCQNHYMQERRAGTLLPKLKETPHLYIFNRIAVTESNCWEWQKSKTNGYGRLIKDGKGWPAHAYSYTVFIQPIPEGKQINHTCHNRCCVNPDHLYAGTQADNMRDMNRAGRRNQVHGSKDGNSKISENIAKQIYTHQGIARIIADKFNVSISLVYAIKKKQIWRHIHE